MIFIIHVFNGFHFRIMQTSAQQRFESAFPNVIKRYGLSLVGAVALMYFGYQYLPLPVPEVNGVADQLVYALRWQMPAVALLVFFIHDVGMARKDTGTPDPVTVRHEPESLAVRRAVLLNTVEQLLLHSPSMLVLATYLRPDQLKLIPILSCLFVVGRLWYRVGYINPENLRTNRASGMGLTFFPTLAVIVYNMYRLVSGCLY